MTEGVEAGRSLAEQPWPLWACAMQGRMGPLSRGRQLGHVHADATRKPAQCVLFKLTANSGAVSAVPCGHLLVHNLPTHNAMARGARPLAAVPTYVTSGRSGDVWLEYPLGAGIRLLKDPSFAISSNEKKCFFGEGRVHGRMRSLYRRKAARMGGVYQYVGLPLGM